MKRSVYTAAKLREIKTRTAPTAIGLVAQPSDH